MKQTIVEDDATCAADERLAELVMHGAREDGRPSLLRIRDATVRRGDKAILDRLHLEIQTGEHTAILGPNGSGKSSLLKLITQDYRPLARLEGGPVVEIFGRARWDVVTLRTSLGVVSADLQRDFLDTAVSASLCGLEVALSGFFASRGVFSHHVITEMKQRRAQEALTQMDGAHLATKLIREMSTGEVRRVLIARALVSDPPALLLDEPTAGLDIVARHRFLQTVRALAHGGKTIVLVSHRVEEIIPEISRVVLLREGRVFRDGPKDEVLTDENLSAAFDASLRIETGGGQYRVTLSDPVG